MDGTCVEWDRSVGKVSSGQKYPRRATVVNNKESSLVLERFHLECPSGKGSSGSCQNRYRSAEQCWDNNAVSLLFSGLSPMTQFRFLLAFFPFDFFWFNKNSIVAMTCEETLPERFVCFSLRDDQEQRMLLFDRTRTKRRPLAFPFSFSFSLLYEIVFAEFDMEWEYSPAGLHHNRNSDAREEMETINTVNVPYS